MRWDTFSNGWRGRFLSFIAEAVKMAFRDTDLLILYLSAVETAKMGKRAPARGPLAAAVE